ncbi:class I SAM-dependent methyltransferase [Marinobacter nauticus]|uniref:Methyltransferase family protein n=1 Tax=Marinobacter nauticus TaxID=2743 RepID=A0A368UXZ4_MARNT|nr:class I SAM-dependent methyltransferase [Marinobacter nauticus]RBP72692.1 methyltransferase family protein [Marinobacter nauticus]RCW33619.1 methyltransferase family protein [Marinobacter nauticus]
MDEQHKPIADFYNQQYHGDSKSAAPSNHLRHLCQKLEVTGEQKVLDIACGKGTWLEVCHQQGAQVSGIDISSKAIAACQQLIPDGDFRCQPAEILPYEDRSFDLITCLGSLEHFLDQEQAISEMARVAKADAKIVILVPNSGFLTYRLGLYTGTQQQAVRETIRSLDEWREMMEGNNLIVEKRWKDLHILDRSWIFRRPYITTPLRAAQAFVLPFWPLTWQYQVYHLCRPTSCKNHISS